MVERKFMKSMTNRRALDLKHSNLDISFTLNGVFYLLINMTNNQTISSANCRSEHSKILQRSAQIHSDAVQIQCEVCVGLLLQSHSRLHLKISRPHKPKCCRHTKTDKSICTSDHHTDMWFIRKLLSQRLMHAIIQNASVC